MKLLLLLCFFASASFLCAQAPDPTLQEAVTSMLPPKFAIYGPITILLIAGIGRGIKALQNGQGVRGWVHALFYGTNVPSKLLIACLCMLSLTSCETTAAFLASPFGRATLASADALGKAVIQTTERAGLEQIILQAGDKVAALNAEGVNADLVKEMLRKSETAGFQAVIDAAQSKYVKLTGGRFTVGKQPVKVAASRVSKRARSVPDSGQDCPRYSPEQVPECLRIVSIPDYGWRVAFQLRTAANH
jgi:hypothetical protein